jgi:hypothetical protein
MLPSAPLKVSPPHPDSAFGAQILGFESALRVPIGAVSCLRSGRKKGPGFEVMEPETISRCGYNSFV